MDYRARITIEPGKRGGKPCIRGLRIAVTRCSNTSPVTPARHDVRLAEDAAAQSRALGGADRKTVPGGLQALRLAATPAETADDVRLRDRSPDEPLYYASCPSMPPGILRSSPFSSEPAWKPRASG